MHEVIRLNICLVSKGYPPETNWGGTSIYARNLAQGLAKLGHEVHVISFATSEPKRYIDGKVYVDRIKAKVKVRMLSAIVHGAYTYKKILETIKKYSIDIVTAPLGLLEDSLALSIAKIKPFVISIHPPTYNDVYYGLNLPLKLSLEGFCLLKADRIIVTTLKNAQLLVHRYNVREQKIRIIPYGIDLSKFRTTKSGLKRKLNLVGKKVVLFVGRLEKRKGVHVLVDCVSEVVKRVPNAYFVFIGQDTNTAPAGGSFKKYIYEKTRENGCSDHVFIVGHLSEADPLIEYYSLCDVFVLPSFYESFGLVYIEAMACSKPVIGTNIGGIPEVISDGKTGILIPPGDSKALENVIVSLLTNEEKCRELGLNARREVEKSFSDVSMAKKTLEVFGELV